MQSFNYLILFLMHKVFYHWDFQKQSNWGIGNIEVMCNLFQNEFIFFQMIAIFCRFRYIQNLRIQDRMKIPKNKQELERNSEYM